MRRILILDTDSDRRERSAFLLRHMGYMVDLHPAGDSELDMKMRKPDLVLVSEQMLAAGGHGIARRVLSRFDVPKVVMGSEPEEVAGIPYLELGADVYLPAPLDLRLLLARVRTLLDRPRGRKDCPEWMDPVARSVRQKDAGMAA